MALCFCTDTRNTQWEDPRLQSPAITGPVSIWLTKRQNLWKHRVEAFYVDAARCSMLLQTSVHVELLSFTLCFLFLCTTKTNHHVSTTQHTNTHVLFCAPLQILFHVDGHAVTNAHCCANPHITSPTSVWKVNDLCVWVYAGCTLLQRVQAEIWLLQEEIEETSKAKISINKLS